MESPDFSTDLLDLLNELKISAEDNQIFLQCNIHTVDDVQILYKDKERFKQLSARTKLLEKQITYLENHLRKICFRAARKTSAIPLCKPRNIVYIPEGFAGIIDAPIASLNVDLCLGTSDITTCVGILISTNLTDRCRGLVAHLDSGHTQHVSRYIDSFLQQLGQEQGIIYQVQLIYTKSRVSSAINETSGVDLALLGAINTTFGNNSNCLLKQPIETDYPSDYRLNIKEGIAYKYIEKSTGISEAIFNRRVLRHLAADALRYFCLVIPNPYNKMAVLERLQPLTSNPDEYQVTQSLATMFPNNPVAMQQQPQVCASILQARTTFEETPDPALGIKP